jgi:4-amino-4-deoxyprephenate dehydrogenase
VTALRSCVVVGGAGAVGGMFAGLLARDGVEVHVVDTAPGPAGESGHLDRTDITRFGPRLAARLGRADLVLLAVPEEVALAAVRPVAAALRPGALLVDTLSVKSRIVDATRRHAGGAEVISLNPLFAPSLGIRGRPVAAVVTRDGPRGRELLRLIEHWGGRVLRLSAEEHDRLAGATQALTHAAVLAFGFALAELDVGIAELDGFGPPPHRTMLALLARIVSGSAQTYWDVQAANRHGERARAALANGVHRLADLVANGTAAEFGAAVGTLRDLFDDDLERHGTRCARIFDHTHPDVGSPAGGADL